MLAMAIAAVVGVDAAQAAEVLHAAGLARALPASGTPPVDMAGWQERVLGQWEAAGLDEAQGEAPVIGRLWEQLAADIFVANLEQPCWGWVVDPRLLAFWAAFEPRIRFVLVGCSPEYALIEALHHAQAWDPEGVLAAWQRSTTAMLRFFHRHADRCLMVDVAHVARNPQQLVELVHGHWQAPLELGEQVHWKKTNLAGEIETALLDMHCARQWVERYPDAQALYNEFLACSMMADAGVQPSPTADDLLGSWRMLTRQVAEEAERQAAQRRFLEQTLAERDGQLAEAEARAAALVQERDALTAERQSLEARLQDVTEENELILAQLHQVQEELESHFLKLQEKGQRLEAALAEAAALQAELGSRDAAIAEQAQRIAGLEEELRQRGERAASLEGQLAQAQQERDAAVGRGSELEQELAQARQEREALAAEVQNRTVQLAEAEARAAALVQERDALRAERQSLEARLQDVTEENELILAQLHQVQEELEHYFLEHQAARQEVERWQRRWQRMLAHTPGYCAADAMEATPQEDGTLAWRLTGWEDAWGEVPVLEFRTVVEHGVAGFLLDPGACPHALLRWPDVEGPVAISPVATPDTAAQRAEVLANLSIRDWGRLHLVASQLPQAPYFQALPDEERQRHQEAWQAWARLLEPWAGVLRYDAVRLERALALSEYEHLELVCEGLTFQGRTWPRAVFRVACAAIAPGAFGQHPRLEFPFMSGEPLLEAWYEENADAPLGPRLELRFALPEATDLQVWERLSARDRQLVQELLRRLPHMLDLVRREGASIPRPWEEWLAAVQAMAAIVARYAETPAVPEDTKAEEAVEEAVVEEAEPAVIAGDGFELVLDEDAAKPLPGRRSRRFA